VIIMGGSTSRRWGALLAAGVVAALVPPPAPAGAAAQLRYYSKETSFQFLNAAGKTISAPTGPGDKFTSTDANYRGDHRRHAKRYTSTGHSICTLVDGTTAVCDLQIAIGGSMVLSRHATVTLGKRAVKVPVTGGTGRFGKARGSITIVKVSDKSSDMTIDLR
jgi:hypothetical protein